MSGGQSGTEHGGPFPGPRLQETAAAAGPLPARRRLPAAAERALREAEERRRLRDGSAAAPPPETGGRDGPDPVRYGDWENGGIASDF